jgi:mannose-6-phosphate isomerase-like protein (cupin superfamily)
MKVIYAPHAAEAANPNGLSMRPLCATPQFTAVHLELRPGESTPRHPAPSDVFFYVLEGSGLIEVGEESAQLSRDIGLESAAGVMHRISNTGDSPLRLLVIRAPKSSAPPRFVGEA